MYNLRPNPKPSRKVVENSGDQDHNPKNLDDNSTQIHNEQNTDPHTSSTDTPTESHESSITSIHGGSEDEFHGFDSNIDIEIDRNNRMEQLISRSLHESADFNTHTYENGETYSSSQPQPIADDFEQHSLNTASGQSERISSPTKPTPHDFIETADRTTSSPSPSDLLTQIQSMFRSLETKVGSIETNINNKVESIESNISSKVESLETNISHIETNLKGEIKAHYELINNKIEMLTESQTKLQLEVNNLLEIQQQQSAEIKQIETKLTSQITESSYNLKIEFKSDLNAHRNEVNDTIYAQNKLIQDDLNATLHNSLSKIETKMQINNETLKMNTQKIHDTLEPLIKENKSKLEQNNTAIQDIAQTLNEHSSKIESLENDSINKHTTLSPTIYVTCGNGQTTDSSLPKFSGREHNPREFLNKLKRFYEKSCMRQPPKTNMTEHLIDSIKMSLERNASRWFSLIKGEINCWQDFENVFLAKFWSREVQRGIKQRMEVEKYRPSGKLTRSEYFIKRVITLKSMTPPPLTEDEIVTILSEHFSELIQNARLVQNANTIAAFESLLQREDIKDSHRKIKHNTPQTRSRSPSPQRTTQKQYPNISSNQNYQHYRDNINPNAYQPRHDRNNQYRQYPQNPQYNRQNQPYWRQPQYNRSPHDTYQQTGRNNDSQPPMPDQKQVYTTIAERQNPQQQQPDQT